MRGASNNRAPQMSLTRRSKSRVGLSPRRERLFTPHLLPARSDLASCPLPLPRPMDFTTVVVYT
jgi:hypothetical protein